MRTRTLQRIRMSGLSTAEYLCGVALSQLLVGVLQAFLVVLVLYWAGVRSLGSWYVLLLGILLVAASAIACGLMLGAFIRNDSQAVNLGFTVTMVQVFLCGAFYPTPTPNLMTILGHPIGWFDWLPATNALMAMQQTLIFHSPIEQVTFRLGLAGLETAVWLGIGIFCFQHVRMKAE
jgi:hypothetical protein